jgi:ADP-ribose pyrophosphatase
MKKVEVHGRRRLLDDFFQIDELTLSHELLDGRMSRPLRRLVLERGDAVAILLFRPADQRVVLVRQFRAPLKGWMLEVVAGILDPREEPAAAARREILEETGYQVEELEQIAAFYTTPGGSSEHIHLYFAQVSEAQRLAPGGGCAAEDEDIEVVELGLEEVWALLDAGRIEDAKTLIALMWLRAKSLPRP